LKKINPETNLLKCYLQIQFLYQSRLVPSPLQTHVM